VQSSGENALVNIRGIGKSDGGAQDSSGVLIYRDGVSTTPNGLISDEPYYDIASVEVLRGPQGTFAGQNATGGAIFINEANPTLDHFGGWVEGQYGNYNDVRIRGAVNKGYPPTLIQGGTKEWLLSDMVCLHRAIKAAGGNCDLEIYEGMPHGFPGLMADAPEGREAKAEQLAFLKRYLPAAKR
jgi:acetyl esterase/lipase